ncbi:RHS repeat-associated core domain-containing protein [Thermodesulfitimonas autotrophica]|uniref:RHS repeat-associated core domain-containing protein n=1 Tax=Thermodesulfitimonas autotrophica TaxID=1894989 RepID=UPI0014750D91|nr:RHS repeat-associated core domain-containing protein [Thermodesulfitimonas autotrophica]
MLLTADAEGNYRAAYSYGLDLLSIEHLDNTRPKAQEPLYYLQDGLGSVRQLVTPAGRPRAKYDYDPFGLPLTGGKLPGANANVLYNPYGFTGEQHDRETGFIYLRARYYDPETGRFMSRDPVPGTVFNPLSLNAYLYVLNNPVNLVDPSGKDWFKVGLAITSGSFLAVGLVGLAVSSPVIIGVATFAGFVVTGVSMGYTEWQYRQGKISKAERNTSLALGGLGLLTGGVGRVASGMVGTIAKGLSVGIGKTTATYNFAKGLAEEITLQPRKKVRPRPPVPKPGHPPKKQKRDAA